MECIMRKVRYINRTDQAAAGCRVRCLKGADVGSRPEYEEQSYISTVSFWYQSVIY